MSTHQNTTAHRVAKLKRLAADSNFPYSTVRDAAVRGEYPLIRVGRALYAEIRDFDNWIETRKERA